MIIRPIFHTIRTRILASRHFIQVLLGPRQVGKTTLVKQLIDNIQMPAHYANADDSHGFATGWIKTQWEQARLKVGEQSGVLIIDEVQKLLNWSTEIKSLWDEDTRLGRKLQVILLGSSPWLVRQDLRESLAGRFEVIPITHWSYAEMHNAFYFSLQDYAYFGGYPGAATLVDRENVQRWMNYINDSLIETAIARDILLMARINKPALLRRLFELGSIYSGQVISYQKILGQLQDAGNTTTLAHYLELLKGAGLLAGIPKYANQQIRQRASSPKLQVFNTALMTAQLKKDYKDAYNDSACWGRIIESVIGAYLLNASRGKNIELFYWRDGSYEVDFILKRDRYLTAIEVKSGHHKEKLSGLEKFIHLFKPQKVLLLGQQGIPIEEFLLAPIETWVS